MLGRILSQKTIILVKTTTAKPTIMKAIIIIIVNKETCTDLTRSVCLYTFISLQLVYVYTDTFLSY